MMSQLVRLVPTEYDDYYEPFCGSASLFFNLAPHNKNIFLNDVNPVVCNAHNMIKDHPSDLARSIDQLMEDNYLVPAKNQTDAAQLKTIAKAMYTKLLTQFNEMKKKDTVYDGKSSSINFASIFIVLLSLTFGALYIERKDGNMIAGFGPRTRIKGSDWKCFDVRNILQAHSVMQKNNVQLTSMDFETCIDNAKKGDFVFLDPPYLGTRVTQYVRQAFDDQDQMRLCEAFKRLTDKGVKAMMTNVNTECLKQMYNSYRSLPIVTSRDIAHVGNDAHEVVILNF